MSLIQGLPLGKKEPFLAVHHHIVFLSPNGSTRSVALALGQGLSGNDPGIRLTDLADSEGFAGLLGFLGRKEESCLFVGSPVYFNRAVPPVMAFIENLPPSDGTWAVPFVTYGKACSGIALWQMASTLQAKGYRIAGAAKVQAVHSLMWESKNQVGGGHPDEKELDQVRAFAGTLRRRLSAGSLIPLDLDDLDYHPPGLTKELRSLLGEPWPIMPKSVDEGICTECGTCADECPVGTVTLCPFPKFGTECIDCFNCLRLCPEEAISSETPLAAIGDMVQDRVNTMNETPLTQMFLPPLP